MKLAPVVESYKEHADGLCGLVFAVNVDHSNKIVSQYTLTQTQTREIVNLLSTHCGSVELKSLVTSGSQRRGPISRI
jgi:hypothetical protein